MYVFPTRYGFPPHISLGIMFPTLSSGKCFPGARCFSRLDGLYWAWWLLYDILLFDTHLFFVYTYQLLSVIKARFSCILVNFTCRFEDSPSVPERSYEQSVDILGYYYASISHVSTNYPLNFYSLSIDNSFMKVLKNAKSEMPTMFHSSLPSKLPMERMLLQCPNTSMKG